MNFPHYITVRRSGGAAPSPGSQDPDDGTWSDDPDVPDDTVVTKGRADVQDVGVMINRTADGMPVRVADLTAFWRTESKVKLCRPGDLVTIEWNDGTPDTEARVKEVRRLDGSLALEHA